MLRLGDVFSRLHVTTKAGTLGLTSVLLASVLFFWGEGQLYVKQGLTLVFVFLTAPVAGHLISSAAYRIGTPRWDRTRLDEAAPHLPVRGDGRLLSEEETGENRTQEPRGSASRKKAGHRR